MSSEQFLIDAASRHAVFIQRYSASIEKKTGKTIEAIFEELSELVDNPVALNNKARELFGALEDDVLDGIIQFIESEGRFSVDMLNTAVSAPVIPVDPQVFRRVIESQPIDVEPGRSITVRQSLREFSSAKINQINQAVRDGRTEGQTSQEVVKRLVALTPLQKTQAGALVRTANNAASTIAAFETFEKNRNLFDGYKWVSTLDGRTSLICMSRDGQLYPFDNNSPRPPAHWGCRSVIVPKVKRKFDLLADLEGTRPSETGEVGTKTTYGGWLRKQPKSFVEEALGPARAELFLSGKVKIDGFVDPTGRTYTIEELENTNRLAL